MATCVLPLDLLNHIYNCHDASHSSAAADRGKDQGGSDKAGDKGKGKGKAKSSKTDRKNGPTDVPDIRLHHYFNDPQADVVFLSAEKLGFAVPSHYVLKHSPNFGELLQRNPLDSALRIAMPTLTNDSTEAIVGFFHTGIYEILHVGACCHDVIERLYAMFELKCNLAIRYLHDRIVDHGQAHPGCLLATASARQDITMGKMAIEMLPAKIDMLQMWDWIERELWEGWRESFQKAIVASRTVGRGEGADGKANGREGGRLKTKKTKPKGSEGRGGAYRKDAMDWALVAELFDPPKPEGCECACERSKGGLPALSRAAFDVNGPKLRPPKSAAKGVPVAKASSSSSDVWVKPGESSSGAKRP